MSFHCFVFFDSLIWQVEFHLPGNTTTAWKTPKPKVNKDGDVVTWNQAFFYTPVFQMISELLLIDGRFFFAEQKLDDSDQIVRGKFNFPDPDAPWDWKYLPTFGLILFKFKCRYIFQSHGAHRRI